MPGGNGVMADGRIPPRYGEGDQLCWWRGTREWSCYLDVVTTGLYPTTILRMVPLPVPGRIW